MEACLTIAQLKGYVAFCAERAKLSAEDEAIIIAGEGSLSGTRFPIEEYHLGEGWVALSRKEFDACSAHARECHACDNRLRSAEHYCTMNRPPCDSLEEYLGICARTSHRLDILEAGPRPDVNYE